MRVVNKKIMFQRMYDSLPTSVSNESVCSENCFVCVTDIAPRLCLARTKWILLFSFYACS